MDAGIDLPRDSGRLLSSSTDGIKNGVEIIDHIERRRCQIRTSKPVSPQIISSDEFWFPVDHGFSIAAEKLVLPYTMAVYIRNQTGIMIDELTSDDFRKFPEGQYSIEFSAPIKLYVSIESDFEIDVTSDDVTILLDNLTEVYVGARSHHEQPAATVTTTSNPSDLMEAISYLGSGLKTISCERSYPTLRGHPPEIKLGDQLHIPPVLEKPKSEVMIEVPPDLRSICVISPLAYYLAANVRPGKNPQIVTTDGFVYELANDEYQFENTVGRILKKCFFLDCLTRTEGYYQVSLHERNELEPDLDLDFSSLYELPISEQLKTYLDIPFEILRSYIPQWKMTAYIETDVKNIEILPFLSNDLAIIRSAQETVVDRYRPGDKSNKTQYGDSVEVNKFVRNNLKTGILRSSSGNHLNMRSNKKQIEEPEEYVQLTETDACERIWVGEGIPVDASKGMVEAFRNRIQRDLIDDDINITVIVNDEKMMDEGNTVDEVYNSREEISFSVDAYQNLTVSELSDIISGDADFLHYIGHIDKDGFECIDGKLDIRSLNKTGVDTFLLNACSSYSQAIELIKLGSIVGIATFKPILDSGAKRVGETIARLLNLGFPFITALNIAKSESIIGENYVVIGDGQLTLTQSKNGIPSLCDLSTDGKRRNVKYETYLTRKRDIGSITIPYAKNNQDYYLTSGTTGEFSMDDRELLDFLSMGKMPVKLNSTLYWSSNNEFIKQFTQPMDQKQ